MCRSSWQEHSVDYLVAVGADYANWLTNYYRYFAGLSAVIVAADGETTLVTSPDELPLAQERSTATRARSYGEGGFGLDLNPMASLLTGAQGRRRAPACKACGRGGDHRRHRGRDGLGRADRA